MGSVSRRYFSKRMIRGLLSFFALGLEAGCSRTARKTSIDGRTTRHMGPILSQGKRKMIECLFGWGKQHGTMRKTKHRGLVRVAADFLLNLIGYNLVRIPKLLAQRG